QQQASDPATTAARIGAARALGRIGDPRSLGPLTAALGEPHPTLQAAAARALATLGLPEARTQIEPLAAALNPQVRAAAIESLARLGLEPSLELVLRAMADGEEVVRRAAVAALGLQAEVAFVELLEALRSPDASVREGAANELGRLERLAAIDSLVDALEDTVPAVRRAVERALRNLGWVPVGWRVRRTDRGYALWTTRSFWLTPGSAEGAGQVELLCDALRHGEADRRRNAAEALGRIGASEARGELLALLGDPDPDVRVVAAQALVVLGETPAAEPRWVPYWVSEGAWGLLAGLGEGAVEPLAGVLGDPDPARRRGAVEALARIGNGAAVAPLIRVLGDGESEIRRMAASALGRLAAAEAVAPLIQLLGDPGSEPEAARALGAIGEAAVEPLARALACGDPTVRCWAAEALGLTGRAEALPPLLAALELPDAALRQRVLEALSRLRLAEAAPAAQQVLLGDPAGAVRLAAARLLGELGDATAVPALRLGLADSFAEVGRACVQALAALGAPPADELLAAAQAIAEERWERCRELGEPARELLQRVASFPADDPRGVANRATALRCLGQLADPRVLPILAAAVNAMSPVVQAAAAWALGELGLPGCTAPLLQLAGARSTTVRAAAIRALGRLGGDGQLPQIFAALDDPVEEVRIAATAALGRTGEQTFARLLEGLRSLDAGVREAAAVELGQLGQPSAIDPLVQALEDPVPSVRRAVERALLALGWRPVGWRVRRSDRGYALWTPRSFWLQPDSPPDATQLELLLRALRHPEADRRRNAAESLGNFRERAAREPLYALLADPELDVRMVAAQSLVALGETPAAEPCWVPYWVAEGAWELLVGLGEPAVEALAGVLSDRQTLRRCGAVQALGRIGGPAAVAALVGALGDEESRVRRAAAAELGWLKAPAAVAALAGLLGDEGAAAEAVAALAAIGEAAVGPLARMLAGEDAAARLRAVEALGRGGCTQALPPLLELLDCPHGELRCRALEALGRLAGPEAAAAALQTLRTDPEGAVRAAAARLLGVCGAAAAEAVPELRRCLADSFAEVRRASEQALQELGAPPSPELLAAAILIAEERWERCVELGEAATELLLHVAGERGGDPRSLKNRGAALRCLGRLADARALPVLLAAAGEMSPVVQEAAAWALGELRLDACADPLQRLAGSRSESVRAAAVQAIGRLGRAELLPLLRAAQQDPASAVRVAATVALGQDGESSAPRLLEALHGADPALRAAAAEALGLQGELAAIDPLVGLLDDGVAEVRRAAEQSLLRLGWVPIGWRARRTDRGFVCWTERSFWLGEDARASQLELLVAALGHPDQVRRRNAAEGLGRIGDRRAVEPLAALLADPDADVQVVAAQALVALGEQPQASAAWAPYWVAVGSWEMAVQLGEPAVASLAGVLQERDVERRSRALAALARIGGPAVVVPLLAALGDETIGLRRAAVQA
ncbi:MAG: HEAT repeat domain-containing protein, partial [Deltaproteobacteria bacterium]|nr:HEAT repeat domain-containing protein [Deltaproteobacteria bacterium]